MSHDGGGQSARVTARVNLAAIERNTRTLVGASPRLCAVLKADAYGHGAVQCAAAVLAGGASVLAVATPEEAAELRADGVAAPIIVLGAMTRAETGRALAAGAEVVAWSDELLNWVIAEGGGRVHIKLDTGMGRLGTRDGALADHLVARVLATDALELAGVMTHFATADQRDGFLDEQRERFTVWLAALRERHGPIPAHAENSAALLSAGKSSFDMARCGIALYGLDPFGEDAGARGLEPALELRSWVATLKPCIPGDSAGYGRRFIAGRQTTLGIAPLGYADGVRRVLSPGAEVLVAGRRRPLAGTISMDSLAIDLGPEGEIAVGAEVVLIGGEGSVRVSAEELARRAGTINYEITCGLSARVPREYHRDGEPAGG
jgi:alanine racemase